jgi:methylmalonyl-CoA mutase N-terminal domain/subunit
VNIVRTALEALSAVLGGTQSLHTNARDEALGLPTEESAQIALRTQQIIAYESGVTNTADPVGGSYYIETLTDRIENEVQAYIKRIDGMGGALRAIESGFIQAEIQNAAFEFQREIERGGEASVPVFRIDTALEQAQVKRVRELRGARDGAAWAAALDSLEAAARGGENLTPRILEAAAANATVGEISDRLRAVFGEYRDAG